MWSACGGPPTPLDDRLACGGVCGWLVDTSTGEGEGIQSVCVREVHYHIFFVNRVRRGNDRTKSPEPCWVFGVTPSEDGIKAKQMTL